MSEPAVANLPLDKAESFRLADLEDTIERGLVHVGQALAQIRDEQLWRGTHESFRDYCLDRWSMSHRHANRKIQAAEVLAELGPMGPAANERQTRELAPLLDAPDQLRDAWQEANANGNATAVTVREAVGRRLPEPRPTAVRPLDPDVMEKQQRDTAVENISRAVFTLEGNAADVPGKVDWILETRDLGSLTPSRFEHAAAYCAAFAAELRERGLTDGQN